MRVRHRSDMAEVERFLDTPVKWYSSGMRMRRARVRCVACGRVVAGTMRRKYCSEKCRQWAYYHRHIDAQRARSRERHDRRRMEADGDGPSDDDTAPDDLPD